MVDGHWFTPGSRFGGAPEQAVDGRARDTHEFALDGVPIVLGHASPGPRDVRRLRRGAIRRRVPHPGTPSAEEEQRPYVELGAVDLPWRYTPGSDAQGRTLPWLFLMVARADQLAPAGGSVTVPPAVQAQHPLADAALWAHVQRESEHGSPDAGVARVLCGRRFDAAHPTLETETEHIAALVIPWDQHGSPAWPKGGGPVEVPCLDWWSFRTGPPLGFRELALELRRSDAEPIGTVRVHWADTTLRVPGALTTIEPAGGDEPSGIGLGLVPPTTLDGRVVVGPAAYGAPWAGETAVRDRTAAAEPPEASWLWPEQLNADLHRRVVAAVGAQAGIDLQEEVVLAASRAWRAGPAITAVLSSLALGLSATRSAWARRVGPADAASRIRLLGPAAGRLPAVDADGVERRTVREAVARPDTGRAAYPVELLGPVVRRVLRAGGPSSRHAAPLAARPEDVLEQANRREEVPDRALDALEVGMADPEDLDPNHADAAAYDIEQESGPQARREALRELAGEVEADVDLDELRPGPAEEPHRPFDLGRFADLLTGALDPTGPSAPALRRVTGRVGGIDADRLLVPLEDCPDLDLPAWRYLRDRAPHWLLPGADTLTSGEVVALRTNPEFVEAFLVGLNQQSLAELRWRQHPVRAGCTPLRRMWDRVRPENHPGTGALEDVLGVAGWVGPDRVPLGRLGGHPPDGVTAELLVVVVRSELFRRYPRTLLCLAAMSGPDGPPDLAARDWPAFVTALADDLTMFAFAVPHADVDQRWVVVEEIPDGIRFGTSPAGAPGLPDADGSDAGVWAQRLVLRPIRVLMRGGPLIGRAEP